MPSPRARRRSPIRSRHSRRTAATSSPRRRYTAEASTFFRTLFRNTASKRPSSTPTTFPSSKERSGKTREPSILKRSAIRTATFPTSTRSQRSLTNTASPSSLTTPSERRFSSGRSSTARTSSSTRRRNSSAATERRSAGSSSKAENSTGRRAENTRTSRKRTRATTAFHSLTSSAPRPS